VQIIAASNDIILPRS